MMTVQSNSKAVGRPVLVTLDIPPSRRGLSRWTPQRIVQEDIEAAQQFAESHPEDVRCRLFVDSDVKRGQTLEAEANFFISVIIWQQWASKCSASCRYCVRYSVLL